MFTLLTALCFASALLFVMLYARSSWFRDEVGWSVMLLAGCTALTPLAVLIALHVHFDYGIFLLGMSFLFTAVVMAWRTATMVRYNRDTGESPAVSDGVETIDSSDEGVSR